MEIFKKNFVKVRIIRVRFVNDVSQAPISEASKNIDKEVLSQNG